MNIKNLFIAITLAFTSLASFADVHISDWTVTAQKNWNEGQEEYKSGEWRWIDKNGDNRVNLNLDLYNHITIKLPIACNCYTSKKINPWQLIICDQRFNQKKVLKSFDAAVKLNESAIKITSSQYSNTESTWRLESYGRVYLKFVQKPCACNSSTQKKIKYRMGWFDEAAFRDMDAFYRAQSGFLARLLSGFRIPG